MIDASRIGLLITDGTGRIVWVNQALERYLGVGRDDVLGRDRRDFIETHVRDLVDDPEQVHALVHAATDPTLTPQRLRLHVRRGNGRDERLLEHWTLPARDGAYQGGQIEYYADVGAPDDLT